MKRTVLLSLFFSTTFGSIWLSSEYSFQNFTLAQVSQAEQSGDQLLAKGITQYQQQEFRQAIATWEEALTIYRGVPNRLKESKVLSNLAAAYFSLEDYSQALVYYQQRLEISRELSDRYGEADTLNSIGRTYFYLRDYKQAIKAYRESLAIAQSLQIHLGEKVTLDNLGEAYQELGNYTQALKHYSQSLTLANQINDPHFQAESLYNLGVISNHLDEPSQAIEYLDQSLNLLQKSSHFSQERQALEAKILNNLGIAHRQKNNFKKSIEYHQKSLAITQKMQWSEQEIVTLSNLGLAYTASQSLEKGIAYQQQSLQISQKINNLPLQVEILLNLGNLYLDTNQYELAIDNFEQALTIANNLKSFRLKQIVINNLGIALLKDGRIAEVENLLNQLDNLEAEAEEQGYISLAFAKEYRNSYRTFQKLLKNQNKIDAALRVAQQENFREFRELLKQADYQESVNTQPLSLLELQAIAINKQTTIIQYSIIWEQELYIWVIQSNGRVNFRTLDISRFLKDTGESSIENLIRKTLIAIQAEDNQASSLYLRQLYQMVIQPIGNLLPKTPEIPLMIIPQDELYYIPFAALTSSTGDYLIEKYSIVITPVVQVLTTAEGSHETQPTLIAGYTPNLTGMSNRELEAQAVASFFNTQALIGVDANLATITQQLPSATLIHLAAESQYNSMQPVNSGILLAPGSERIPLSSDNLLTAADLFFMDLNARMAVISNHQFNQTELEHQALYSLSTAWLTAGVPRVIFSLWPVEDNITQQFWREFYQNTSNQPRTSLALRETMLKTMKQKPAPKYWAGYVLIGTF